MEKNSFQTIFQRDPRGFRAPGGKEPGTHGACAMGPVWPGRRPPGSEPPAVLSQPCHLPAVCPRPNFSLLVCEAGTRWDLFHGWSWGLNERIRVHCIAWHLAHGQHPGGASCWYPHDHHHHLLPLPHRHCFHSLHTRLDARCARLPRPGLPRRPHHLQVHLLPFPLLTLLMLLWPPGCLSSVQTPICPRVRLCAVSALGAPAGAPPPTGPCWPRYPPGPFLCLLQVFPHMPW